MEKPDAAALSALADSLRLDVVRMIGPNTRGHFGGSLSCADIVAALYFYEMHLKPNDPAWQERDRLILSKGHACPVQYAALARRGYFPAQAMATLKVLGSPLQGHPDHARLPGIEANTGSLGQGLSQGAGMALALEKDAPTARVFVVLGDGELNEGQVWEAVMFAGARRLARLTAIVDHNGLQAMGPTCQRLDIGALAPKFEAFGWRTLSIDGHDMNEVLGALAMTREADRPTAIIARTVKGKGVPAGEGQVGFHHGQLNDAQYAQAECALGCGKEGVL